MNLRGRIVVIGGYGNFGRRICRALAMRAPAEIVVAGRKLANAERFAQELRNGGTAAAITAAEMDLAHPNFVRQLGAVAPIVVVHAAGPFQHQDYAVAEACLACRSHYIDLADGREFVTGIGGLDRDARRRDVLLVAGASTLPAISSTVVDELSRDFSAIDSIETTIVPAGRTVRGEATVAAVSSYCGKPIAMLEDGSWTTRYGWQDSRLVRYPTFSRRAAACDVPDLEIFPRLYSGIRTVTFHAGPAARWQHAALWSMAAMTRIGLVKDWSRYSRLLTRIDTLAARIGSATGAMRVRVRGTRLTGDKIERTWDLTARRNDGPQIPCAPSVIVAHKLLNGVLQERGAKPCIGLLNLDELADALREFDIDWQITEESVPCYQPTCS